MRAANMMLYRTAQAHNGSTARTRTRSIVAAALLTFASMPLAAHAQDAFAIGSANFHDGGEVAAAQVFNQESCKGGNRSPQLTWRNAPAGTRSYAVTIFDPDASSRGWWHWAVADIPAHVKTLPENASASGAIGKMGAIEARNDFAGDGYGGPCPPAGKPHRYIVTVYALKVDKLALAPGRPATMFDHEIEDATLGSAKLTVTYGR
ncbi:YbhB/YbcL family Raf kinase inhibitor-like protein [Paraburkholderia sp. Ac-20340]|uniref:YbhB/YbcL family Raf kinase inhibitor-like protein n=1 Tax=Paraburkholderia sp. Ac-20340 TaxID=2703888 RepID=UPI001F1193E5|nr:YbhB/YbcL family Raf kinase inhibitor-like protein [Paraburkholderia sp. Ac-20340]